MDLQKVSDIISKLDQCDREYSAGGITAGDWINRVYALNAEFPLPSPARGICVVKETGEVCRYETQYDCVVVWATSKLDGRKNMPHNYILDSLEHFYRNNNLVHERRKQIVSEL